MTAMTITSTAPLTAAEYLAFPESEVRLELQDGALVVKPRPTPQHQSSMAELLVQLDRRSPDLVPLFTVDVDLGLVPPDEPGTVRTPAPASPPATSAASSATSTRNR